MLAILLWALAFIGLVLMTIQPWWAKIKLRGGKGLKMLGWWLGLGVGLPSVAVLVVSGQPVANILVKAGLFGVMAIAQNPDTDGHDHRGMALDECLKGGGVTTFDEAAQESPIRLAAPVVE